MLEGSQCRINERWEVDYKREGHSVIKNVNSSKYHYNTLDDSQSTSMTDFWEDFVNDSEVEEGVDALHRA